MAKIQEHTTANGIVKGRPGAGKVLSLGERKSCYAGHKMTKDNTFRYTKPVTRLANGHVDRKAPKPTERIWCRTCRAVSRKGSHTRRVAAEEKAERASARTARATVEAGMTKGKARKAAPATVKASGGKAKAKPATRKASATVKAKAASSTPSRKAASARGVKKAASSTPSRKASATVKAKARKAAPAPKARKPASTPKPAPEISGSASTARRRAVSVGTPPPRGNTAGGS